MEEIILSIGRTPRQRSTTYGEVNELQRQKSFGAMVMVEPTYTSAKKYERKQSRKKQELVRNELEPEKLTSQDII